MRICLFTVDKFENSGMGLVKLYGSFLLFKGDGTSQRVDGEVWLDPDEVDSSSWILGELESPNIGDTINQEDA